MCHSTGANTRTETLAVATPLEILGPNPKRKSFLVTPIAAVGGFISLSLRPDVVAGSGILNYTAGAAFPTLIDDDMIGDAIGQPWWIVSSIGGEVVQITEFSYDE